MSATLTTPNYNLPLYAEADSTSWADFNKLSTDVDNSLKTVADSGGTTAGQVQELTTKVDNLTQTVNTVDVTVTQQGTDIAALKNDAVTTDDAIANLNTKANANETNISNLSTQVTETVLPEVNKNTTDIASLTTNVSTLQTTISQQGTRITSLEAKVPNDLQSQLTTLSNSVDDVTGEIAAGLALQAKPALSFSANYMTDDDSPYIQIQAENGLQKGVYMVSVSASQIRTTQTSYLGVGYIWSEPVDEQSGRYTVTQSCQVFNVSNSNTVSTKLTFLIVNYNATPLQPIAKIKIKGDLNSSTQGLDGLSFNLGEFNSNILVALN